jgi:hypothetical protein
MTPGVSVAVLHVSELLICPQVEGWENLPAKDEAAVYISNHQSFLVGSRMTSLSRHFQHTQ